MEFVAGVDLVVAGLAKMQASSVDELTHPELLAQLDRLKAAVWALPAVENRLVARLAAEADPKALGAMSLVQVLTTRLRISKGEAQRRIKHAELFGPRTAMTGEPVAGAPENAQTAPPNGSHLRTWKVGSDAPTTTTTPSATWSIRTRRRRR